MGHGTARLAKLVDSISSNGRLRTVTGRQHLTVGRPAPRVQPTRGGADFSENFVSNEFAPCEPSLAHAVVLGLIAMREQGLYVTKHCKTRVNVNS